MGGIDYRLVLLAVVLLDWPDWQVCSKLFHDLGEPFLKIRNRNRTDIQIPKLRMLLKNFGFADFINIPKYPAPPKINAGRY